MGTYAYYQCYKCKKPYFGGRKECGVEIDYFEFKPEKLVCAECSDVGINVKVCDKHGKDFIEYKCKFCCSVA